MTLYIIPTNFIVGTVYSIVLCLAADERLYQCAFIWFKVRQAWCLANIKFSAVMNAPIGHLHHHLLSGQLQLMICNIHCCKPATVELVPTQPSENETNHRVKTLHGCLPACDGNEAILLGLLCLTVTAAGKSFVAACAHKL